jgi:hypothetical protein
VRDEKSESVILNKRFIYILLTGLFLLIGVNSFAQKQRPKNDSWYDDKPLHFGFTLGMNLMDFDITPSKTYLSSDPQSWLNPEVTILNPGINIQIVTNLRLGPHFDLRFLPGVSFGQRNIRFYKIQTDNNSVDLFEEVYNESQRLESSFLEFPFLLKYKGERLNNVRPYIIGGINYRYDLAGKKEYDDEKMIFLRLKRSDIYYEAGAGLDFYLPYFKLSVEIKMSNGIRDIIVHDPAPRNPMFADAIDKVRSQVWVLSFHFE